MDNIIQSLQTIGLTKLEGEIFMYILENGPIKASQIYKVLKRDKSSTYRIVYSLEKQGLVSSLGEKYGESYIANNLDVVKSLVNSKQKDIKVASDTISDFMTKFKEGIPEEYKNHNITLFEGSDGYLQIMNKKLEIPNSEIKSISSVESTIDVYPKYPNYIKEYIKRRTDKNISIKVLACVTETNEDLVDEFVSDNKKQLKQVKYLPKDIQLKAGISIFGEYTAIQNKYKNRYLSVLIKDKFITDMFSQLFELIWSVI